ncbi:MAG: PLDc N-terminal domain-containing protein [Proteobacteria bacterium]|nr:PLDc N-terminal domain-containing protein [Pseudomonadota bacterium]
MTGFLAAHLLSVALVLITALLLVKLLREHRAPASTLAWGLAIALIPYVGIPLYLLLGGRKTRDVARRKGGLYPVLGVTEHGGDPGDGAAVRSLRSAGIPAPWPGNAVRLISDGQVAYTALLELIDSAQETLSVATFILGRDDVGRALVERLARRAGEGVRVRLLLDALGCLKTRNRFVEPLRRAGGEVAIFLPVFPWHRKWSANLRNHRKLAVADGCRALVGGMNLAAEYLGPGVDPARWHDAVASVEGPAVGELCRVFAADWHFATGQHLPELATAAPRGTAPVAVVASGPDAPGDAIRDALLSAVIEARRRIWLATPYFVPDPALLDVLALRARSGCDVRVVVPRRSNHVLADRVRRPALRKLVDAGASVFFFDAGMLHAKLVAVDEEVGFVGSANLDMRSLFLNYELAAVLLGPNEVAQVATCIDTYARQGLRQGEDSAELRPWGSELLEDALQTLAPLL